MSIARKTGTPAIDAMTAAASMAALASAIPRCTGKSLGSGSNTIRPDVFRSKGNRSGLPTSNRQSPTCNWIVATSVR